MFRSLILFLLPLLVFGQTAEELAKAMDERPYPVDMRAELTMTLTNKQGKTRESTIKSISAEDNTKQIIWFLSPADDKGVAFLKIEHESGEDEMRLWLPAFQKVRRISSKKKADPAFVRRYVVCLVAFWGFEALWRYKLNQETELFTILGLVGREHALSVLEIRQKRGFSFLSNPHVLGCVLLGRLISSVF